MFLGGTSEGPQTAWLVVWLSEDTVDSGLVASQATEVAKAPMVDGYMAIGGRVAVWGLAELLRCMEVGRQVLPWGPFGG